MKRIVLLFFLAASFSIQAGMAQEKEKEVKKAKLGTFYIKKGTCESCSENQPYHLSEKQLVAIEKARSQTKTKYFMVKGATIVVPPENVITRKGFKPYSTKEIKVKN